MLCLMIKNILIFFKLIIDENTIDVGLFIKYTLILIVFMILNNNYIMYTSQISTLNIN